MEFFAVVGLALVGYFLFAQKPGPSKAGSPAGTGGTPARGGKVAYPLAGILATSTVVREVQTSTIPRISGKERMANATKIFKAFKRAGWSDSVAVAAIVNANYESRLSNKAVGDSGNSVGLFQVHKIHGMSVSDRMNPTKNIAFILRDIAKNGGTIVDLDQGGATIAELSGQFGRDIERPRDREGALRKRADYARTLFPYIANRTTQNTRIVT